MQEYETAAGIAKNRSDPPFCEEPKPEYFLTDSYPKNIRGEVSLLFFS